jgi:hypothetical protein
MANVKFSGLPAATTLQPTDIFCVTQGGTSKQSTLGNLWEATAVGNANYTILPTDVLVYTSVGFTAPRTWTLPDAGAYGAGRILRICDAIGTTSTTNTLTIVAAAGDIFAGGTTVTFNTPGQGVLVVSDGNFIWTIVGITFPPYSAISGAPVSGWTAIGKVSGSNFTTTSLTLVDITGVSVALSASTLYEIQVMLDIQTDATPGMQQGFHFSGTGTPVFCLMQEQTSSSAIALSAVGSIVALDSAQGAAVNFANGEGIYYAYGWFRVGTGAGNLTVRTQKTTSGTATVKIGSFIRARPM